MQITDKVYYHEKDSRGYMIKYPAVIHAIEGDIAFIITGRLNVMTSRTEVFRRQSPLEELTPRRVPCSFEDELEP